MFLREVKRQNKNGTQASYLQLVHNQWDPAARASRTRILYSFGRTDQVERAAIQRLIASLSRLLDPATAFTTTASCELTFVEARPLGGAHLLDGMWHRLGIDTVMGTLLAGRRLDRRVERVLFALVATGPWTPAPNSPPPAGSPTTSTSTACPPPATTPATGRWTGC